MSNNANIDETILVNTMMPKSWTCPHCGKRSKTGTYSDEILLEHGIVFEDCPHCGFVHTWRLKLSDNFKKDIINMLLGVEVIISHSPTSTKK